MSNFLTEVFTRHNAVHHPTDSLDPGQQAEFDDYLPFISLDTLDTQLRQQIIEALRELHNNTGMLWRAGYCKAAIIINKEIAEILRRHHLTFITTIMQNGVHFWTDVQIENTPNLVIDPAGLNEGMRTYNLPFFGVINECNRKYAQSCYRQGHPINRQTENQLEQVARHFMYYPQR